MMVIILLPLSQTNNQCVCVSRALYISYLCALELIAVQKLLKTNQWATLLSCVIFSFTINTNTVVHFKLSPTYTILLPQIFTRAPNMDLSPAESSPQ